MKKLEELKKRSFFKEKPQNLFKLANSVSSKLFETLNPFSFLTTQEAKDYANFIVKDCGVTEKAIRKILVVSFEADSIFLELLGEHHDISDQGKKIVKQYTKAIDALEVILKDELAGTGIQKSIQSDITHLKKERASYASLHLVHPEFKAEPTSKSATTMISNQVYNLFLYIKKSIEKSGKRAVKKSIYELISELFMALYDHPAFQASEKFTPEKIRNYCDNIRHHSHHTNRKKTAIRKDIETHFA